MPIGGISVCAMRRGISSLRLRQSTRAMGSGPLGHRASRGLGTTGGENGPAQIAQAALPNTAVRTLGPGGRLNSSWQMDITISTVMAMGKPANRLGDASTSWPGAFEVVIKYHQRSCSPHCEGAPKTPATVITSKEHGCLANKDQLSQSSGFLARADNLSWGYSFPPYCIHNWVYFLLRPQDGL